MKWYQSWLDIQRRELEKREESCVAKGDWIIAAVQ